eukprot:COSAG05_NODE_100_length_19386_cov_396.467154_18_plen_80_part_00
MSTNIANANQKLRIRSLNPVLQKVTKIASKRPGRRCLLHNESKAGMGTKTIVARGGVMAASEVAASKRSRARDESQFQK